MCALGALACRPARRCCTAARSPSPIALQVPLRCLRYRRLGLLAASLAAELCYLAGAVAAWRANPRAALWVLALPYCVATLALMFGK